MPFTKAALISVVVCLAIATGADADQRRGRGRSRGHRSRVFVQPRIVVRPPVVVARRHAYPGSVVPFGARHAYRPVRRPGLGIGIYIGSPFRHSYRAYSRPYYATPYSYAYPYPYGYGYATPYPYPAYSGIYAAPPADALYGGVRLDVTPRDAAVYVDGYYAGVVDDFDGAWQRVALEPGAHRFEIVAPGFETLTFDVNVRPNQTVRYRGDMRRMAP
jgi:hypothetical protein